MTTIHHTATATFEPSPTSIVAALGGLFGARLNLEVQRLRVQQRRYCAQKHHRKERENRAAFRACGWGGHGGKERLRRKGMER